MFKAHCESNGQPLQSDVTIPFLKAFISSGLVLIVVIVWTWDKVFSFQLLRPNTSIM